MGQGESLRVQRDAGNQWALGAPFLQPVILLEPRQPQRLAAVELVPNDTQTSVAKMYANLVRALHQRFALEQRVAGESFQHFKNRPRAFAAPRINARHA